jgi:putative membrane protein
MEPSINEALPEPFFKKNDKRARRLIWTFSIIVFVAVAMLSRVKLSVNLGFDPHVFATFNAVVNTFVALLLIAAYISVRSKMYYLHKTLMLTAIILSVLFLVSYICHHLFSGDTLYGDLNHDGILSTREKILAGNTRYVYYVILATHIPLAGIILPFILFTAYRSLSGEYARHMKLARITWPIWFYVAVSGVTVYLMIRPYYP